MTTQESINKLKESNKRLADFLAQPHEIGLNGWWTIFAELSMNVHEDLLNIKP
jgi:hypothetical protein